MIYSTTVAHRRHLFMWVWYKAFHIAIAIYSAKPISSMCLCFHGLRIPKEDCQPVPWLIFSFLKKLLSDTCPLDKDISQGDNTTLAVLYQVILLLHVQSVTETN